MKRMKTKSKMVVVDEVGFIVWRRARGRPQFRVGFNNVRPADLPMAKALARVYELWVQFREAR